MKYTIEESTYKSIADAIRQKTNTTDLMTSAEMAGKVLSITTGSGGAASADADKPVKFIDFDGTLVKSYTAEEFSALTALPEAPDHSADAVPLTFDGWNWTLDDAKEQVNGYGEAIIGANYHTSDGMVHIIIHNFGLTEGDQADDPGIDFYIRKGMTHIDYGDGAEEDLSSTSTTAEKKNHVYPAAGDYHVKITVNSDYTYYISDCDADFVNEIYLPTGVEAIGCDGYIKQYAKTPLKKVSLPSSIIRLKDRNFAACPSLQSVVIPPNVTSIENSTFSYCSSLQSVAIPHGVTSIAIQAFDDCYSLQSVVIPSGVKAIAGSAFSYCYSLQSVVTPSSVTSISNRVFYNCSSLQSVVISPGVTNIESQAFFNCYSLQSVVIPSSVTSIGDSAFYGCTSLQSVTVPSGVTSIGDSVFYNCSSLQSVTMIAKDPPVLKSSNALPSGIKNIYVPYRKQYESASNWSEFTGKFIGYGPKLDLTGITLTAQNTINIYNQDAVSVVSAVYNDDSDAVKDEQKGITWSVSGNATITLSDDYSCTVKPNGAAAGDVITVTAASTYNSEISSTATIKVVYEEKSISVNCQSGQWVQMTDGVTANQFKSDAGSYHVSSGTSTAILTFKGFDTFSIYCRSNGESGYDYLEVGPIDGTVSRDGSSNLLTLKSKGSATAWTELALTFPDTGEHTVQILYSKDGSGDQQEDRGFFYIPDGYYVAVTA